MCQYEHGDNANMSKVLMPMSMMIVPMSMMIMPMSMVIMPMGRIAMVIIVIMEMNLQIRVQRRLQKMNFVRVGEFVCACVFVCLCECVCVFACVCVRAPNKQFPHIVAGTQCRR